MLSRLSNFASECRHHSALSSGEVPWVSPSFFSDAPPSACRHPSTAFARPVRALSILGSASSFYQQMDAEKPQITPSAFICVHLRMNVPSSADHPFLRLRGAPSSFRSLRLRLRTFLATGLSGSAAWGELLRRWKPARRPLLRFASSLCSRSRSNSIELRSAFNIPFTSWSCRIDRSIRSACSFGGIRGSPRSLPERRRAAIRRSSE